MQKSIIQETLTAQLMEIRNKYEFMFILRWSYQIQANSYMLVHLFRGTIASTSQNKNNGKAIN